MHPPNCGRREQGIGRMLIIMVGEVDVVLCRASIFNSYVDLRRGGRGTMGEVGGRPWGWLAEGSLYLKYC